MAWTSPWIRKADILRIAGLGSALFAISSSATVRAEDLGISPRANLNMGLWRSHFDQSDDSGHSTDAWTLASLGTGLQLGLNVWRAFIEWNGTLFLPSYTPPDRLADGTYSSLLGVNLGFKVPVVPVEVFGGLESGGYGLSGGASPAYGGMTWKAGATVNLYLPGSSLHIGLKGEYRQMTIGEDQAGALPDGIQTRSDLYYIGIVIGAG